MCWRGSRGRYTSDPWSCDVQAQMDKKEVITRKQARDAGLKRFFTGKPCAKNGHISESQVSSGMCIECKREQRFNSTEAVKARKAREERNALKTLKTLMSQEARKARKATLEAEAHRLSVARKARKARQKADANKARVAREDRKALIAHRVLVVSNILKRRSTIKR